MAGNSIKVGDVEVVSVVDSFFHCPANVGFPDVPMERWREIEPSVAERNAAQLTICSFVVRTPRRTIVVDTGIGPAGTPAFGIGPGRFPDALSEAGFAVGDIDAVVTTHLHVDHVGWNAREENGRWVPTFPRATYYISRPEYEFWTQPAQLEGAPFLRGQAVALVQDGVAELFDNDVNLADEISVIPTPGHTPAHSSIAITSGNERAYIIGDVAHHPVQVTHPDIRAGFDSDQEMAQRTREALWQQLADTGAKVAAGHFPPPGFGRIVVAEGKRIWQGV